MSGRLSGAKRISKSYYTNPVIDEIVRIIGRGDKTSSDETVRLAGSYKPAVISSTPSFKEIDRITTGNNLERIIPAEYLYLADTQTEMLFLARYAQRRLQQFAAPGNEKSFKNPAINTIARPVYGPIIVSVDTSSSMDGRPAKIAIAAMHQILSLAKKERRACYLITFSVRSKAIDLTEPGRWKMVDDFLTNSFSGGTSGENMLHDAIKRLQTDNFSLADVLIISDFAFAPPTDATMLAIRREQLNDTRFYGLKIGSLKTPYEKLLDKLWVIV